MEIERDFIKRMLRDLARFVARILGYKEAGKLDDAEEELGRAYRGLLGIDRERLAMVDLPSVKLLLGSKQKLDVYAALLREEADILERRGLPDLAARVQKRAIDVVNFGHG